jgi:hypothetical protein
MFGLIQNATRLDERKNSPLTPGKPKIKQKQIITTTVEVLQQRTAALQKQHFENSQKAIMDELKIRQRNESEQLMQLSLRMLLDIVDRQSEVASLDLAQKLYGAKSPRRQNGGRPTSPVSSAFDIKKSGESWKEEMLDDLKKATNGLLNGTPIDYDDKLLASRRVVSIILQLKQESVESKKLSEGDVRKQVNADQDDLLMLTQDPRRAFLQTAPSIRSSSRLNKSVSSPISPLTPLTPLSPSTSPLRQRPSTTVALQSKSFSSSSSLHVLSSISPTSSSVPFHPSMSTSMIETTKLRGDQAILSQKLIRFGDHKARWSTILRNEMRPLKRRAMQNIQLFQTQWIKLIWIGSKTKEWCHRLVQRRGEIEEERAKVQAVIRMQSMFRGGFTRDLHEKFIKVKEMLLSRLWIIRLNIHTKQRKREASLVRSFLNDYANTNPFKVVVSKFRWKIIWTQRAVRGFLKCKRARINVLTRKWIKIERVVARKRKEKQEAAIKKAFASMLEGADDNSIQPHESASGGLNGVKKKKKRSRSVSLLTGRPRSPTSGSGGMSRKDQVSAKKMMHRKMSRRASFGTTSQLAIAELKKNLDIIEEESRLQTANRLIQAMEDCSTLSKKLDFVKNQKNKQIKMSRALLKKLTSSKETVNRVNSKVRRKILTNLYREKRAKWSGRPPRPSTTKAESMAAAKYLLKSENIAQPEALEKAKAAVREPEVWILYSTISNKEFAKMILQGFRDQEAETKDSAEAFWDSLEGAAAAEDESGTS